MPQGGLQSPPWILRFWSLLKFQVQRYTERCCVLTLFFLPEFLPFSPKFPPGEWGSEEKLMYSCKGATAKLNVILFRNGYCYMLDTCLAHQEKLHCLGNNMNCGVIFICKWQIFLILFYLFLTSMKKYICIYTPRCR